MSAVNLYAVLATIERMRLPPGENPTINLTLGTVMTRVEDLPHVRTAEAAEQDVVAYLERAENGAAVEWQGSPRDLLALIRHDIESGAHVRDDTFKSVQNLNEGAGGLTYDQIVVACRNVGVDLRCGACAGVFYTGVTLAPHTCARSGAT